MQMYAYVYETATWRTTGMAQAAWWLVSHPLLRPGAAMGDGGTDGGMGGRKGSDTGEGAEELGALLGEERPPARERGRCCRR